MKFFASLVLLICLTSTASLRASESTAQAEAKVVLDAQSSCRIGELVRLDASESSADSFKWILIPNSEDFLVYDDGRRAVFSARANGEYTFFISVAKNGAIDAVVHTIRVLEAPPKPETDNLAELIPFWNWSIELPEAECLALAASFEALAKRDDLAAPEDWIKATAEANREVLGDSIDSWKPLLDKIGSILAQMAQEGSLLTPEDHQRAWKTIAEGLRNA